MQSKAATIAEYLDSLPEERRAPMREMVALVREHLPAGYEERMQYGMACWGIPLSRYPNTYNGQPLGIVALASQKQYMSLYLMAIYGDPDTERWFQEAWAKSGKKLDMGKSCLRFKRLDDLALDVLAKAIGLVSPEVLIERYEKARAATAGAKKKAAG